MVFTQDENAVETYVKSAAIWTVFLVISYITQAAQDPDLLLGLVCYGICAGVGFAFMHRNFLRAKLERRSFF